jgi:hypothetical protein
MREMRDEQKKNEERYRKFLRELDISDDNPNI